MKCSVEYAVKKIILDHYRAYKRPLRQDELEGFVRQCVGNAYSPNEFSSVLSKLKNGGAIIEYPIGSFSPNYSEVEI